MGESVKEIAGLVGERLGDRVKAIYHFGLAFAQGPRGPSIRLLVLVDEIDIDLLERAAALRERVQAHDAMLRLDTVVNFQASTDVFPVLTFELLNSKELVWGEEDPLQDLKLNPAELRSGVEHGLRATRRDLMRAYLDGLEDRERAVALRRAARRALMMLEAGLMIAGHTIPDPPTAEALVEAAKGAALITDDFETWASLRKFGDYQETLPHERLVALHGEVLMALQALIITVDRLEIAGGGTG